MCVGMARLTLVYACINIIKKVDPIHNKLPQTPEAMILLLSLAFIVAISRDVITIGKVFSIYLPFLTACIPIVYIAIFISTSNIWIILRIRMRCIKNNTS